MLLWVISVATDSKSPKGMGPLRNTRLRDNWATSAVKRIASPSNLNYDIAVGTTNCPSSFSGEVNCFTGLTRKVGLRRLESTVSAWYKM